MDIHPSYRLLWTVSSIMVSIVSSANLEGFFLMKAHLVHLTGYSVSLMCHRLVRNNSDHCTYATMPVC